NSPGEALTAIKANPPDLILSDQLMPGMPGSQLLEEARLAAPRTLRIMMSGFVPLNQLTMITSAHQYVAKPFDAPQLKKMLERTFAARDRVPDKALQTVVASLRSLPSLPQLHHTLLTELENNRGASAAIGQMVAKDAGLSAKVLQLANSPLFGRDYLVSSPAEAVFCLGTGMITAVVLSQSLFKHYHNTTHPDFSLEQVWHHCWETAALAQCYCREHKLPRQETEEAFMAGLLHETGRLILIANYPDQYTEACVAARKAQSPLGPRLREVFPAGPCEIGAFLLDLWGMPDSVVAAVSMLENPEKEKATGFTAVSSLYFADQIASRGTPPDPFPPEEWNPAYPRSIGLPEELKQWVRP
ncbi:MAG TPA: HDOD domain-containing protein, partial [Candidatus Cybelea sp.]|nr:HDOD domain-containing protein [Candidatus Cybelea sp.]